MTKTVPRDSASGSNEQECSAAPDIERLMHAIYEAQLDLDELAKREHLTLTRLAQWAVEPPTIAALDGLCRLNDARAQMLVSRYRTLAAAKLFEIANCDDGGELARKACVDLLKVTLVGITRDGESSSYVPPALDERMARMFLSRMAATPSPAPEGGAPVDPVDETSSNDAAPAGAPAA